MQVSRSSKLPGGKGKKRERLLLQVLWQDEVDVCSAILVRCNPQLKGLVELERRCGDTMQEVKLSSERQEVLKGMVEDKIRLPSRTTEKYYDQIFEEMELEEKKSREAPLIVQKNHDLWRDENERYYERRLERSGSSRRTRKDADTQDLSLLRHACHRRWITSKK